MADRILSKDAEKIICMLYKIYLERRKKGESKDDASYFDRSDELQKTTFPNSLEDDITSDCWELHRIGYLNCRPGDDLANDIRLTNSAVIYMENRFKNGIADVVMFLSNFIP